MPLLVEFIDEPDLVYLREKNDFHDGLVTGLPGEARVNSGCLRFRLFHGLESIRDDASPARLKNPLFARQNPDACLSASLSEKIFDVDE